MNKRVILLAALVLVTLCFAARPAQAQTVVATDPVGFVTTSLPATGYTYFGVNLTTAPALTSSSTILSGNTVNVGIDLASLDSNKNYFMEIKEGTYEGFAADIASWSSQTLTLTENIESGGIVKANFDGSRVCIQELPTLNSMFGSDNSAGLKSGTLATADIIYILSGGTFSRYYYSPGGFGGTPEWRDESGNPAGDTTIHFGDGLIIQTNDTAGKTISISGSVKIGPTNVPIYEGFNLISNPSPIEDRLTLGTSGLKDGLLAGTAGTADIVYLPNGSGGFDRYYYSPGGFGGTAEWREVDSGSNADNVLLPNSGAFYVDRQSGTSSVMLPEDLPNQ